MDLNSVDLGDARSLLLELARALSPLVNPTSSAANTLFFNHRFVPPRDFPTSLYERHPVQVLVRLHEVQEEVQRWVGAPEPEKTQGSCPSKESEKEAFERELHHQTKAANFEEPHARIWTQKDGAISPLVREVRQLIHLVQGAIAQLSSSASIQQSDEGVLRDTLKKLKPGLDRIIHAIAEVQQKSPERGAEKGGRVLPSLPIPMRQKVVMQKLRELRQEKTQTAEGIEKDKPARKALPAQTPAKNELSQEKQRSSTQEQVQKEPISKNHKERRLQKPIQENVEPPKEKPAENRIGRATSEKREQVQKNAHSEIKPVALPVSALIFDTKKITPARKKKKRKGFWFKDEEDVK